MGKRDNRYAFMNPIAMARSKGQTSNAGPTIKDYLNRDRPTWDEVKKLIQKKERTCSTLEAWEKKMNEEYRQTLEKQREEKLGASGTTEGSCSAGTCGTSHRKRKQRTKRHRSVNSFRSSSGSRSRSRSKKSSSREKKRKSDKRHHTSKRSGDWAQDREQRKRKLSLSCNIEESTSSSKYVGKKKKKRKRRESKTREKIDY